MIWHFFEIWLLLFAAFVIGSCLGALLYTAFARSSLAGSQAVLADAIGDVIDAIKRGLGVGPVWRLRLRRATIRPSREPDFAGDARELMRDQASAEAIASLSPAGGGRRAAVDGGADDAWDEGEDWWDEGESIGDADDSDRAVEPVRKRAEPSPVEVTPMRPVGIAAPRNSVPDNLQRIRGIGKRNEELLNSLGIFHFGQIAAWTPGEVRWVAAYLAFPERIDRDDWISQATILASGGDTGYVKVDRRKQKKEEDDSAEI